MRPTCIVRWSTSRWRRTIGRALLTAAIAATAQSARADEDQLHKPVPPSGGPRFVECDLKAIRPKPCHVHDPRTAEKLPLIRPRSRIPTPGRSTRRGGLAGSR